MIRIKVEGQEDSGASEIYLRSITKQNLFVASKKEAMLYKAKYFLWLFTVYEDVLKKYVVKSKIKYKIEVIKDEIKRKDESEEIDELEKLILEINNPRTDILWGTNSTITTFARGCIAN